MNMRTYVTMSATAMLVLGGCIIVTDPASSGGAGGEGVGNRGNNGGSGVSTGGNGGAGVGGVAGMGMGGKGGSGGTAGMGGAGVGGAGVGGMGMGGAAGMGGGPSCTTSCADAVTNGVEICANDPNSQALFDALHTCTCVNTSSSLPPGCKDDCDANLCTTGTGDMACNNCVSANCAVQYNACVNDT